MFSFIFLIFFLDAECSAFYYAFVRKVIQVVQNGWDKCNVRGGRGGGYKATEQSTQRFIAVVGFTIYVFFLCFVIVQKYKYQYLHIYIYIILKSFCLILNLTAASLINCCSNTIAAVIWVTLIELSIAENYYLLIAISQ